LLHLPAFAEHFRVFAPDNPTGEEVDPEKPGRDQPDFVDYLREAHGHVYGPEYWKTYVRQIASLWLTPLR
jgi:hypothetical protein